MMRKKGKKHNSPKLKKQLYLCVGIVILTFLITKFLTAQYKSQSLFTPAFLIPKKQVITAPEIQENLLTPNQYSRPQIPLEQVNGIVIHYVGNPGSTAEANRDYFNNLANTKTTYASSHFVIDIDGTIIQCLPLTEISYCSNDRNYDTISIECCHPDATGKFTDETYHSLVQLVAWLSASYNLEQDDIIRHYDITGKRCPLYFVDHPRAWTTFKKEVSSYNK